jgi:hypothetical protein
VEVLPIIRDVFRSVEKENNDGSQRNKDSLDASLKILELVGFILQKFAVLVRWSEVACTNVA